VLNGTSRFGRYPESNPEDTTERPHIFLDKVRNKSSIRKITATNSHDGGLLPLPPRLHVDGIVCKCGGTGIIALQVIRPFAVRAFDVHSGRERDGGNRRKAFVRLSRG